MKRSSVDVVVVCCENPGELESTLQSIRSARTTSYRIIVSDGSHTIRCQEVAAGYLDFGDVFIRGPDSGPYDAMNKGARAGSADYIWFLNSGDRVHLEARLDEVESRLDGSSDIVCFAVTVRAASGEPLETTVKTAEGLMTSMGPHQGMFFRRTAFAAAGGYDLRYRYIADYDLVKRMLASGGRVVAFTNPVADFYLGGISSSVAKRREELHYAQPDTWRGRLLKYLRLWSLSLQ